MPGDAQKLKVLFLCTGNSCRSQMAEGWTRHLKGDVIDACSAGTDTHGINQDAVRVMAEAGVDISQHYAKQLDEFNGTEFDYVVTVCKDAYYFCPHFPGAEKTIHVGFDDPPLLARTARSSEQALDMFRRVRDEIRTFVEQLPEALEQIYQSQHREAIDD